MAKMGGARVFFTLLAEMQVDKLVEDSRAAANIMQTVYIDAIDGVLESMTELFNTWGEFTQEVVDAAMPVEEARIHFAKFFDDGQTAARALQDEIMGIGNAFNISAEDAISAGARMMQLQPVLGSQEAAVGAATGAMLMGTVGMMGTDQALSQMMQLQMQTGFMYSGFDRDALSSQQQRTVVLGRTVELVNQLNEAENKTGATIQGITQSMSQYAASAQLANMEMSEQIALSASLIEQGEEQGKSGRALKMILARIASDRSENNALLEQHGVIVKDEYGNMKPLLQIMTELKTQTDETGRSWDQLTGIEKQNIAIAVSGSHHYVRFLKLMESYDRTLQIQADVQDSAGSAMQEFSNFTNSAAFQLQRLNTAINNQQALLGEALIPSMRDAANVELMFLKTRNALLDTYVGKRFSLFMNTGNVVMEQVGSFMQLIFMYRATVLAMRTMSLVQANMTKQQATTEKARRVEIEQLKMGSMARAQYAEAFRMGVSAQELYMRGEYSMLQINHAINEGQVTRIKNLLHSHQVHSTVTEGEIAALKKKEGFTAKDINMKRQKYILDAAEIEVLTNKVKALELENGQLNYNILLNDRRIRLSNDLSTAAVKEVQMENARMRSTMALNRVEAQLAQNRIATSETEAAVSNAKFEKLKKELQVTHLMNIVERERLALLEAAAGTKAVNIRLDQTQTAALRAEARAGMAAASATATQTRMKMLGSKVNTMYAFSLNHGTNALMLASMMSSFFGESQEAAAASAALMTAAMVPMTLSMMSYTASAEAGALATSVITMGAAALIGGATYYMMKHSKKVSAFDKEMEDLQKEIDATVQATKDLEKEFGKVSDPADWEMWAGATSDSLGTVKDEMKEFADMRQELFFGGKAGRMDQALFNEVKQNGVEKLFYAPEIHMTNTFNGLTYHAAAEMIADLVEKRMEVRNRQSVTGF